MVLVLGGAALGFGGLLASSGMSPGTTWSSVALWAFAAVTLIFSLSMAVVITLSFARRLSALAGAARRLAFGGSAEDAEETRGDAIASLARSLDKMSERVQELRATLDRTSEEERGRLDARVRERTRELYEENEDLRRVLGDSKGVLSVDPQGTLLSHGFEAIPRWLGQPPKAAKFWDYFDRAAPGAGVRFEAAWSELTSQAPGQLDLRRLPRTLAVGERYLALEYRAVCGAGGALQRVLIVLSDISIPEPDPATPL